MEQKVPKKSAIYGTYELKGAQKGVNVLTEYYGIPRMRIIVDGRKVSRGFLCDYFEAIAMFTKKGLNRRNVLHELYHHLVQNKGLEMSKKIEEMEANRFAREVMKNSKKV